MSSAFSWTLFRHSGVGGSAARFVSAAVARTSTAGSGAGADSGVGAVLADSGSADFELIADAPIATDAQDGQLWNWIDYDNDGDLDAHLTNWAGGVGGLNNRLYRNDGDGFTSTTTGAIVTDSDTSLSSVWGSMMQIMGRLKVWANSKSRVSWAGTAMIAPVP